MTQLRSRLNPEEQHNVIEGPTKYRVGPNQFALTCGLCTERFCVDETTFRRAASAMEEGLDNPFCCEDCEEEYEALAH